MTDEKYPSYQLAVATKHVCNLQNLETKTFNFNYQRSAVCF